MSELKPCPFCGNKKIESYLAHPQYQGKPNESDWCYWCVGCPECGAWFEIGYTPPKTLEDAHREAVEAWNRRATIEPERKPGKWIDERQNHNDV